jgi:pteridine reductase
MLRNELMTQDLSGQVALVTGAARRVGKVIAQALAKQGVNIMIHYNRADDDTVRDTLQDIKSEGVDAFAIQADISQPQGVQQVMSALQGHFGRLNMLVNSASAFPSGHLLDITLESWDLAMNVNARAPFLFTQSAARLMQENDPEGGAIVNIVDQGAYAPWPRRPQHGISKAALWMLTQVSALSLAPHIRVNAIAPGPIMKPPHMPDAMWASFGEQLPVGHVGTAQDVGEAVTFLMSQSYITGALLHVNGGEHLTYPDYEIDY